MIVLQDRYSQQEIDFTKAIAGYLGVDYLTHFDVLCQSFSEFIRPSAKLVGIFSRRMEKLVNVRKKILYATKKDWLKLQTTYWDNK